MITLGVVLLQKAGIAKRAAAERRRRLRGVGRAN